MSVTAHLNSLPTRKYSPPPLKKGEMNTCLLSHSPRQPLDDIQ